LFCFVLFCVVLFVCLFGLAGHSQNFGQIIFFFCSPPQGQHVSGVVSDAATEELAGLRLRVDELSSRLEEATRHEREMARKWLEEKRTLAREVYEREKLKLEARAAARVAKVVDRVLDKTTDVIKTSLTADPDMPNPVRKVMRSTVDGVMPDVREEVLGTVVAKIRTKAAIDEGAPLRCCPNPLAWFRAWVLYTLFPHDRSVWRKIKNPWFWVLTAVSLVPRYGVQQLYFLMIIAFKDKRDEFQLVQYILAFKGFQFIGGVIKTVSGAMLYWACANTLDDSISCLDDGPSAEYFEVGFFALQIFLVWGAALALPFSERKGAVRFVLAENEAPNPEDVGTPGCLGMTRYAGRGGKIKWFVIYDTLIFFIAVGFLAYLTFVNEATKVDSDNPDSIKMLKANFYWVMTVYQLLSFPFALLKMPLMYALLTHAKVTAYSRWGRCVPPIKRPIDKPEAEREPFLRRLLASGGGLFGKKFAGDDEPQDDDDRGEEQPGGGGRAAGDDPGKID
jgi:hypothetical protein